MLQTPDLSKEYHPQPKPLKKAKKPNKGLRPGKKTNEWDEARRELKKIFEVNEQTTCELRLTGCWKKNALTFAHIDKRQNLTPDEIMSVCLLCTPCHEKVERMPRLEMRKILSDIIRSRNWQ